MSRKTIDARLSQHSEGGRISLTLNYYVDGVVVKSITKTVANPDHKALDAHLLMMLGADVKWRAESWAREGLLF